ncbi:hypothetical protein CC80DRAFT_397603 [Byssothecium circinans]|uniref:Uncharacterized protein n=1 Tax=Byssothecium circinans TaxID=147558 RepID=A0A6A5UE14_9PLEO|nr:hypothetical protein CC80DRAFT_397603 [Byssothecium circinans]
MNRPLSEKGGFITTKYNETYTLGLGVSMFHALHCIDSIRDIMRQEKAESDHMHPDANTDAIGGDTGEHLEHCLDYIAQVIQCGGDSTIEPPSLTLNDEGYIVKQVVITDGSVHMCKNTDYLYDLVAKSEEVPMPWKEAQPVDTVESLFRLV